MTTREQYDELAKGDPIVAVMNTSRILANYRGWLEQRSLNELMRKIDKLATATVMLDIGCGTGRMFDLWFLHEFKIVGTDNSAGLLEVAHKDYPEQLLIGADAQALPFEDRFVDYSSMLLMLNHESQFECMRMLSEACRVTKKGIIIMDEFYRKDSSWRKPLIETFMNLRGFKLKQEYAVSSNWLTRIMNRKALNTSEVNYTQTIKQSSNWKHIIKIILEFPIDYILRLFNMKNKAWESILYFEREKYE